MMIDESYRGGLSQDRESIQPLIPSEFKFIGHQWSDWFYDDERLIRAGVLILLLFWIVLFW